MQRILLFHDFTLNNGKRSYFRFNYTTKIKYTYFHSRHNNNGQAEYTEPHILHEI